MSTTSEQEQIRRIAYEIWQAEGEPAGRDREHWERSRLLRGAARCRLACCPGRVGLRASPVVNRIAIECRV